MLSAHGEQGRPGKPSRRVRDWHAPGMPGHAPIRSDNLVDNLGASEDHREEATISRGTNLLSRDEFRHSYPGRERPMTSARHPYGTNSEAEPIPRGENRSRVTGPIQFVLRLMEFWRLLCLWPLAMEQLRRKDQEIRQFSDSTVDFGT